MLKEGQSPDVLTEEVERKEAPVEGGIKPVCVLQRHATPTEKGSQGEHKAMVFVYDGILESKCEELFSNPDHNKTYKRRFAGEMGAKMKDVHQQAFDGSTKTGRNAPPSDIGDASMEVHESFMEKAINAAKVGVRDGLNKEKEAFGCVIVKNGEVIAEAVNTTLKDRDATATAETNAIRAATKRLGTYSLEGCDIYTTAHPDLMSLGAILWSRISRVYCGVSQHTAAKYGFEDGLLHFADLLDNTGGKRVTATIENVAKDECENVFKEWKRRAGTIY